MEANASSDNCWEHSGKARSLLAKLRAGSWPAVQTELLVTLGQLQLPLTHPCCHPFLNVQRMHYPCFPIIIHKNTVMQLSLFSPSLKSKLTNLTRTVTRGSCSSWSPWSHRQKKFSRLLWLFRWQLLRWTNELPMSTRNYLLSWEQLVLTQL